MRPQRQGWRRAAQRSAGRLGAGARRWWATIGSRSTEADILFKFRKRSVTEGEQRLAYDALRAAAVTTTNRGAAAGPRGSERHWVSAFELDVLCCLCGISPVSLAEVIRRHEIEIQAGRKPGAYQSGLAQE